MRIHPPEKRQIAIAAKARGETFRQIAQVLGVNIRTVQKWLREYQQSGKDAPATRGHPVAVLLPAQLAQIQALLQSEPDLTLEQILERLGLSCSVATLHRAVRHKLNWHYKKNTACQ